MSAENVAPAETATILVADDDHEIVHAVSKLLEMEGYRVICAYDGMDALDKMVGERIHLIIMDVMMPRLDGLSAIMDIRKTRNIPIIVLSAKTEDSDKILGLSMGADDYITKPYNSMELLARVQSQLRRYMRLGDVLQSGKSEIVRVGGLQFDTGAKQLYVDGEPIKLTATELRIVELLMRNAGRIYSAQEIYSKCWNEEAYAVENTVMVHIRRIREKIEINPREPRYLKVVWGVGYKIEKLPETNPA